MKEVFYMVYMENGITPTYKHSTIEGAEAEAKRLSKLHGRETYVLCSLKSYSLVEFNIEDCRPDIDLPF